MRAFFSAAGTIFGEVEGWAPVAPPNVNDVSYVTRINHESHFSWQAQCLVRLKGDSCCFVQCK